MWEIQTVVSVQLIWSFIKSAKVFENYPHCQFCRAAHPDDFGKKIFRFCLKNNATRVKILTSTERTISEKIPKASSGY